jgi:hypothetical protein
LASSRAEIICRVQDSVPRRPKEDHGKLDMSDRHRAVYVAANAEQAHLLRNLLTEAGIAAFVTNDTLVDPAGWVPRAAGGPGFVPTLPTIIVHEDDAEEARALLLEAESSLGGGEMASELTQLVDATGDEPHWPLCPHCARPRLATCPVCKTSGTDFTEAFLPEEEEPEGPADATDRRLVICPTCDEVFAPKHPARCEWCGHRFGDGYEPRPTQSLVTAPEVFQEFNGRAAILLIAMAAMAAVFLGWFYYVLRGRCPAGEPCSDGRWAYSLPISASGSSLSICRISSVIFIEQNFGPHMLQK